MRVLAIDPGQRTGIAIADACGVAAHVIRGDERAPGVVLGMLLTSRATHVVIERPRIHSVGRTPGDPNDIVELAWLAGEFAGAVRAGAPTVRVERYKPDQWKGSVRKSVHQARVLRDLERRGLATWVAAWQSVDHNGRDALALARWYLDAAGVAT